MKDTIIAISTPVGESAIGVIRLSGGAAIQLAEKAFKGSLPLSKQPVIRYNSGKSSIRKIMKQLMKS